MKNLVSVILPVYNASHYLKDAVESILNQTYTNFEFIIINDGSTDSCCDFLKFLDDKRIKFINHDINRGIIITLNEAIQISRGEYIVRMDSDDISYPDRIKVLVNYMNAHPQTGVAGSYTNLTGKTLYYTKYLISDEIKARLLFDNIFSHPTMIFRKSVFIENGIFYNEKYIHAEDYGLWMELLDKTDYGIIPVPLLKYGIHQNQISNVYRKEQICSVGLIQSRIFNKMNLTLNEKEIELHKKIFFKNYDISPDFFKSAEQWLLKLRRYNAISKTFNDTGFNHITSWVWFEIATHLVSQCICNLKIFKASPLFNPEVYSKVLFLKYRIKSLFCLR